MASSEKNNRLLAYLFAILALSSALFSAWNLPPFMGADEMAHISRANMPTLGEWTGQRWKVGDVAVSGGATNLTLHELEKAYSYLIFQPDRKVKLSTYADTMEVRWDNRIIMAGFPNTIVYPPFFYLPQTLAMAVGKATGLSVIRTIYLARIANTLACVAIGIWALLLAGPARVAMFTVLLLPMSVALYSTITQDGMVIATTALGGALIARALGEGRRMTTREIWGAAACFALVGMTKQPYALLALILLAAPAERPRWKYAAVALALALSIGWAVWMTLSVQTALLKPGETLDPIGQLRFLLAHPETIASLALRTLEIHGKGYLFQFVGILGWLDTPLPTPFYRAAWFVIGLSLLLSLSFGRAHSWRHMRWVAPAVLALVAGAIFAGLYMAWTPVGGPLIEGVQGRYFLPLAVLLPLALVGTRPLFADGGRLRGAISLAVLAFPFLSLLIVQRAIILRYYLGS